MFKIEHIAGETPAQEYPAAGIVVQEQAPSPRLPRSVAFVWGREAAPAPSLPFGRWKPKARAA